MIVFLIIVFVISAILLTTVILIQDDQGEGIGGLFGGGSGTAFGSRTGNVLTRFTSILAAVFLVTAFAVAWLNRSPGDEDIEARARAKALEETEASDWYIRAGELGKEEPEAEEEAAEEGASATAVSADTEESGGSLEAEEGSAATEEKTAEAESSPE